MHMFYVKALVTAMAFFLISISTQLKVQAFEGGVGFFDEETAIASEALGRDEGLSNLSVSSMVQDQYGYLWFGTQEGLNRFDGYEMKTYKYRPFSEDQLPHNLIQTMTYDPDEHLLWIGTYNGASRFDISSETFTNFPPATEETEGLSDPVVIAIEVDRDGMVWFGTSGGLDRLDPETGLLVTYEIPGDVVRSIKQLMDGRLLVGTLEGVLEYDPVTDALEKVDLDLPSDFVMTIDEFQGEIYLGMWDGGVAVLDGAYGMLDLLTFESNQVYALEQTSDGTLWIGTWGGGLFAISGRDERYHYTKEDRRFTIAHDVVYSLLEDSTGILWIGTNGGGITKLNPRKRDYVLFGHEKGIESDLDLGKVNAIYAEPDGDYWIAVYNKGINRLSELGGAVKKYNLDTATLPGNQVMSIYVDYFGQMIAATDQGLARYDEEADSFVDWDILPGPYRTYDIVQSSSELYWIGTYDQGLYSYNRVTEELVSHGFENKKIFSIFHDSRNRLWVGTNNGLLMRHMDQSEFTVFHYETPVPGQLPGNSIEQIYEDSTGRIWFATNGGVAYYDESTGLFGAYTEDQGLSSNYVSAIIECQHGFIWASTHSGISLIDPAKDDIRALNPSHGIGGWEFSGGVFKDMEGNMLFGGIHGVTSIPCGHAFYSDQPHEVHITDIAVNGRPVNLYEGIYDNVTLNLAADERFVTFQFLSINYDNPEGIGYEYRLQGSGAEWQDLYEQTQLSLSNLKAGQYLFEVRAYSSSGVFTEPTQVMFTIDRYWYVKWYAFVLYVALILLIVWMAWGFIRAKNIRIRNHELDRLNLKLEEANLALEQMSVTDALTGLYNRRYLDVKLEEQLHLAVRARTNLALIMLDLDFFKDINDAYGHVRGDHYLQAIAKMMKSSLKRSTDIAVRYGGDEFILMLYDDTVEGAYTMAHELQERLLEVSFEPEASSETTLHPTLSIGVISEVPDRDSTVQDYLNAVDSALYEAKNSGRNKICVGRLVRRRDDQ